MFIEAFVRAIEQAEAIGRQLFVSNLTTFGFAILGLSLLVWRIIKFSLLPALKPDDPKEYPYWIPGIARQLKP